MGAPGQDSPGSLDLKSLINDGPGKGVEGILNVNEDWGTKLPILCWSSVR